MERIGQCGSDKMEKPKKVTNAHQQRRAGGTHKLLVGIVRVNVVGHMHACKVVDGVVEGD